MNEVTEAPKGWRKIKLRDLCKPKEGLRRGPFGSAIKKEFFVPDGYKVYEQANAIYDDSERGRYFINEQKYNELINFNVIPGDLIVSCSGTLGRIAEIPSGAKPGVINQALLRIRLLDNIIQKKFFLYYFRSAAFQKMIFDQSQGTAMSNLIGIKDFKEIELNVPPLEEQHQIVSKIEELFSELDKGIEELKTAQQQLKVYRQAVLKWVFEGKLTNENVKEGKLPEGWSWKLTSELAEKVFDGPFGSHLKSNDYVNEGVRVIRLENIGVLEFRDEYKTYVSRQKYELLRKHTVFKGDIIFSSFVIGETRVVVLPNFIDEAINKADCFCIRVKEDFVDRHFLAYFLSTKNAYNQLVQEVHGATRPRINTTQLKACSVPFCSKEEQRQIVQEIESRLSVCDKVEETIVLSLKQGEALRKSILEKAFIGAL